MSRKRLLVVALVLVIAVVASAYILSLMFGVSIDYFPPHGALTAEKTGNNSIRFTIQGWVHGADGDVSFNNCGFRLSVNNTTTKPLDYFKYPSWGVHTVNGEGALNASVVTDGTAFYIVVFNDDDANGIVSDGDTIVVTSTERLLPGGRYTLVVLTELRSSWTYGYFSGEYVNGQGS